MIELVKSSFDYHSKHNCIQIIRRSLHYLEEVNDFKILHKMRYLKKSRNNLEWRFCISTFCWWLSAAVVLWWRFVILWWFLSIGDRIVELEIHWWWFWRDISFLSLNLGWEDKRYSSSYLQSENTFQLRFLFGFDAT